ncbi:FHA domain-containing protein [Echinimonas agarilytica]|uniref:FHA domain-containing protein n=1 Tax=Echinimonas agarilytica TaxID=1215918 RepID=A0AA41W416_9GAMM|nr:FHA domain-containing protein [Echinimonas agarilytica]MCM2678441.1 FHA domain-containing protein [Echinimonas agarilytica]
MAHIRNIQTGETIYLHVHHIFGRQANGVNTCIQSASISKIHAVIEWNGQQWQIRDLSRNGTWLESNRVELNQRMPLRQGKVISMAAPYGPQYIVEDLSPPCNLLIPESDAPVLQLDAHTLVTINNDPAFVFSLCPDTNEWFAEPLAGDSSERQGPYQNGQRIVWGDLAWTLFVVDPMLQTQDNMTQSTTLHDAFFEFNLSADEESTQLAINTGEHLIELGERSHHYALLQLARHKAEQRLNGLPDSEQGWIYADQLAQELGLEVTHLNILIFRARKQINESLRSVTGLSQLIQRRGGRLRLGDSQFRITKAGSVESEYLFSSSPSPSP